MTVPNWLFGFAGGTTATLATVAAWQAINPQQKTLDANLYMQTSAEYRAICLQTYNWAGERLKQKLAVIQNSEERPPVVVLDLDETVIDNAGFQSYLDSKALPYSDSVWETWERDYPNEVRLIPGAKGFIQEAERQGVLICYISNRLEKHKASTIVVLKNLGFNTDNIERRLLLKAESSDKTARRAQAASLGPVIMLVGDNLRDFSEAFVAPRGDFSKPENRVAGINVRYAAVDRTPYKWGAEWIILPNPVYGEWQKPLGPDPRQALRPSGMK
ncbi:MAG TPA: HAD family acid phosphatase [Fimbriimonadaceae bacterium]|nr:HAD family acid phosphatase [Fimbriimonadaceae bacterium]